MRWMDDKVGYKRKPRHFIQTGILEPDFGTTAGGHSNKSTAEGIGLGLVFY